MKVYLSLLVIQNGGSLAFKILGFDERLRIGKPDFSIPTSTGLSVRSYQFPEINRSSIYLPGSERDRDDDVFVGYTWGESINEFKDKIIKTLYEFLHKWFDTDIGVYFYQKDSGIVIDFLDFNGISQAYTKE